MKCPSCNFIFTAEDADIRSMPQNRYYFGVIVRILSEHFGYTLRETHEILKEEFWFDIVHLKTKTGIKEKKIVKSTTEMTTMEAMKLYEDIRMWASKDFYPPIFIPEPNEIIDDGQT